MQKKLSPKASGTTKQKVVDCTADLIPNVLSQEDLKRQDSEPFKCCACGSLYPNKNKYFSKVRSKLWSGNGFYLPICNSCLDKLYRSYMVALGDREETVKRICMTFDIYYSASIVEMVDELNPKSFIILYIDKTNLKNKPWSDKTFANTLSENENAFNKMTSVDKVNKTINNLNDVSLVLDETKDIEEFSALSNSVKFWGFGFTPEQYDMLNNNYKGWNDNYDCDQYSQVIGYKTMSMLQMKIVENILSGEKVDGLTKQLNDYMGSMNIQPKQKTGVDSNGHQTMGTLLERFEQTRPIPEEEPTLKKKAYLVNYISAFFLGHLMKMINIKNKWFSVYQKEIEKYTVKPPQYEEDNPDDIDFDDVFGQYLDED